MHSIWTLLTITVILLVQQATAESCSAPTKKCKKENGVCISKKEPCFGDVKKGRRWCKDGKKCKCCIGEDKACGDEAEQPPCKVLGGSCMNKDEKCNGREVFSQYFCSGSSCKCCFPREACDGCKEKADTQCSVDIFGMTNEGVCRDNCEEGEIRFDDGDCGPNCRCCFSLGVPEAECKEELEMVCNGDGGLSYNVTCRDHCDTDEIRVGPSVTCRANCGVDEIRVGPCGKAKIDEPQGRSESVTKYRQVFYVMPNDENCGCCIKEGSHVIVIT